MAETYPKFGITVLRQELSGSEVSQITAAIPPELETYDPTFDDGYGNKGYVLWQRNKQPDIPTPLQTALGFITSVQVESDNLRAYQINIQQPGGEQAFHTDSPFSSSLTVNLSPKGLFEYCDTRGRVRAIMVGSGDVIIQSMAKTLLHRGRNPSASVRYTLAMFFNSNISRNTYYGQLI